MRIVVVLAIVAIAAFMFFKKEDPADKLNLSAQEAEQVQKHMDAKLEAAADKFAADINSAINNDDNWK